MRRWMGLLLAGAALAPTAWAFCGFYVAQEPGNLFNQSSKVVLARQGDHTVLTMASDYRGDLKEFGLVVPVPQVIEEGMVRVTEQRLIDELDQYTLPRLAEYFDPDPCPLSTESTGVGQVLTKKFLQSIPAGRTYQSAVQTVPAVRIEAQFSVEEYAVTVIGADMGADVAGWLKEHGYRLPDGADAVLDSYVRQGMHFFLAKIDVTAQAARGITWPRPLQVRYDSPKFMLPVRLGTVNADGAQDLVILALTSKGRVETTNYRTTRVPTEVILPEAMSSNGRFVKFYEAAFERQVERDRMSAVYLEYAWPLVQSCDPCTGVLTTSALTSLGAGWATEYHGGVQGGFITRLHVRYDASHFPEDLVFQETADAEPWQSRFIVHHAVNDPSNDCEALEPYLNEVASREQEAFTSLADLTGWSEIEVNRFLR